MVTTLSLASIPQIFTQALVQQVAAMKRTLQIV